MTIFTGNPADLVANVIGYLEEQMGTRVAVRYFDAHYQPDGGAYGEEHRFHVAPDTLGLDVALQYATRVVGGDTAN